MTEIRWENVPHRKWMGGQIVQTRASRGIMRHMGKLMRLGYAIDFTQGQPENPGPVPVASLDDESPKARELERQRQVMRYKDGTVYDRITVIARP